MRKLELELKQVMSSLSGKPIEITAEEIIIATCQVLDIDRNEMLSPSRKRELAECRTIIAGLLSEKLKLIPRQIAELIGHRDRSTAIHALELYQNLNHSSKAFRDKVDGVLRRLEGLC